AYPKLVIATSEEMFRDFEQRYGDQIPTARGDFTPYWEDGAASSARETALNRATADRLSQAEALFALRQPKAYPAEAFYDAWRNVILYDEHTWGAHNSISQPDHPFVKSQWAIKQAFALEADQQSRKLLAAALDTGAMVEPPASGVNVIDVFNTTAQFIPWALVVVPRELSTAGDGVSTLSTSRESMASQRLTTGELIFRPCIGSHSSTRYYISTNAPRRLAGQGAEAAGNELRAANLRVRIDEKTGAIVSLRYGQKDYELVNTNVSSGLNDYFYLPGSDLKNVQRNGPVQISVKETGPLIASLLIESDAPGCHKLRREVRLHALRNYVEIIDTVDKRAIREKEGVHFGFAFNVPEGQVRMDVPWAVVRPELDQIPGACKNWFTVQRWVDISNQDFGVTWLTPDAPLVQVGGMTANLIGSLPDPRVWRDRLEPSQTIYSWAMNNHWHTNYRAEQDGPTVFRYYLFPHAGGFSSPQAARLAVEQAQPLIVTAARQEPARVAVPRLSNSEVQLTALKPSDDGKGIILRLFGVSGKDATTQIEWSPKQEPALWRCDFGE
ncbi:MAG TPA: glycoside hydrolase family 38 C-terminal domain-containing protein, partial [Bacillota bacterium]|nr:glycoside hydrolase family 38 C-terminal domain-containing protein [Bacillota bacterium]